MDGLFPETYIYFDVQLIKNSLGFKKRIHCIF